MGSLSGALKSVPAPELGAVAMKAAMAKTNLKYIDEVFMGNVLSAGVGQAPATQAVRKAGFGDAIPSTTVNKVCASGMKSIMFGAAAVQAGVHDVVVCGGMESMSRAPHLMSARTGIRLGDAQLVDSLVFDGLWDPYDNQHMGKCAEILADEMTISRDDQDAFAEESYKRARLGKAFHLDHEIVPVEVKERRKTVLVREDEEPFTDTSKLRHLKSAFLQDGTVTAGNASTINDGAAAVVVTSLQVAEDHGLTPLAEILAYADAQRDPVHFTVAPALAIPKVLSMAKLDIADVDLFEINEAFSIVALANAHLLGIPLTNLNIHGGAVALGHPIGASGARIVGTLASALSTGHHGQLGIAAICNGGGGASAILLRALS